MSHLYASFTSEVYFSNVFYFIKVIQYWVKSQKVKSQFLLFLGFWQKSKHSSPISFESAKELARISVLEEKLNLRRKSQFGAQEAKI